MNLAPSVRRLALAVPVLLFFLVGNTAHTETCSCPLPLRFQGCCAAVMQPNAQVVSNNAPTHNAAGFEPWETFYETTLVKIQYRLSECDDDVNDVHTTKYFMRITNTATKKINITYVLGEGDASSDKATWAEQNKYCSLILMPGEIREGMCSKYDRTLSIFVSRRGLLDQPTTSKFIISKLHVYEL